MQCKDCKFWSKERLNSQAGLFAECELPTSERRWSIPAYPISALRHGSISAAFSSSATAPHIPPRLDGVWPAQRSDRAVLRVGVGRHFAGVGANRNRSDGRWCCLRQTSVILASGETGRRYCPS
jgi:hypothetical protein